MKNQYTKLWPRLPKEAGVYLIRNVKNSKRYVGSTNSLFLRGYRHLHQLLTNTHDNSYLQASFNKYGMESFSIEVLFTGDAEEARKVEQEYINTENPEFNLVQVVGPPVEKLEVAVSQYSIEGTFIKTFKSIKSAAREVKCNDTLIVRVCQGKCHTAKGYQWRYAKEQIGRLPNVLEFRKGLGARAMPKEYRSEEVYAWDRRGRLVKKFKSVEEASIFYKIEPRFVMAHLKRLPTAEKTIRKQILSFEETFPENAFPKRRRIKGIKVVMNDGAVCTFRTTVEASQTLGISETTIKRRVQDGLSYKGFKFEHG